MTTEEKFNQVWWALRAIKTEWLSTPTGENVKINTRELTNRGANLSSPTTHDISKCIRILEERKVFRVIERYDVDSFGSYYSTDVDWDRATGFVLAINQQKFDELYKKFENLNNSNQSKQTGRPLSLARKVFAEFEEKKKIPKTSDYYKKLLESFERVTIEKMAKIVAVISEELSLLSFDEREEPPYVVEIPKNKFTKTILLSDVEKIIKLFCQPKFLILPEFPKREGLQIQDINCFFIYYPLHNYGDTDEYFYQYPYGENFNTFKEVVSDLNNTDMDVPPEKQTDDHKIKILANEKLLEEYEPKTSHTHEHIQKIQIVDSKLEVDGLKDGLKAISQLKKKADKPKFPHKLPAGTRWEEITIKFLDDENVFIQVKQFKHTANYKEMGFVGKGNNPNPSEAWTFLKVLAKVNGELTLKDPKARDKYKKQKELLAKSLQNYFSLDYDPFYPYRSSSEKSGNSYKIKITLIPPPTSSEKPDAEENKDDLGLKDYLDEQTPQVYEDE
jgi:hypothetical protein